MQTIGEELRAAKEAKGLSLTEIAEKTRISHTFLKALEDDDYSVIPGDVFVVGFLRTYSKELGLSVKDILARYRALNLSPREAPAPDDREVQHRPKPSLISISHGKRQAEIPAKKRYPVYLIIAALIFIVAVITGIALFLSPNRPMKAQAPKPPAPPALKAPAPAPVAQKPPAQVMKAVTSFRNHTSPPRPLQKPKPVQAAGPLVLKLFAVEDSYYSYRADNTSGMSGILKKGKTRVIKANRQIVLTLGNAGGVRAEFDGRKMGPFGKHAEVVRGIVFSRSTQGAARQ